MIRKLVLAALALTLAFGASFATVQPAEARGGRFIGGLAAGIIGLGVLGAYAHARDRDDRYYYRRPVRAYGDGCYRGPERCYRAPARCFYDRYGDQVCRGGGVTCDRPLICD